jgi:3-phosphoshikimate 1-carboxyvinyltransferase
MRERPIGELAAALKQLGVRVEYLGEEGCPPLRVVPPKDLKMLATRVAFDDPQSSQFISAIMLVSIFLARPTTIELAGRVMSEPYIGMTQAMIGEVLSRQRGPKVVGKYQRGSGGAITLPMPVFRIKGFEMEIEPDASGATYFLGAAAIVPGARCVIDGLPWVVDEPIQGDAWFGGVLDAAGADERADERSTECTGPRLLHGIEWDFANMPDTAMTAAVLACFASPTTENPMAVSTLRGLRTLRVKETDRIEALRKELTKIGARVEVFREGGDEGMRITPPAPSSPHHLAQSGKVVAGVEFDTYNDHRMAMALALVGLRRPGVLIRDPGCVRKTYPTFWRDLAKLYG